MLESAYGTLRTLASTIRNIMVRQKKNIYASYLNVCQCISPLVYLPCTKFWLDALIYIKEDTCEVVCFEYCITPVSKTC
jgi:hypothetical protein